MFWFEKFQKKCAREGWESSEVCLTFGMLYPRNSVSFRALCASPFGTKVSYRIISRSTASVNGMLRMNKINQSLTSFNVNIVTESYLMRSSNVGNRPSPTTRSISFWIFVWMSGSKQICCIKNVIVVGNDDRAGSETSTQIITSWSSEMANIWTDSIAVATDELNYTKTVWSRRHLTIVIPASFG